MIPNTFNEASMIKVIFVNINTPPPTIIVLRNGDDAQGWTFSCKMVFPEFFCDGTTYNKSFSLRLVAKIAMGYRGYGLPVNELISEGNIGLMQAVKKFDPDKGFRLATYGV